MFLLFLVFLFLFTIILAKYYLKSNNIYESFSILDITKQINEMKGKLNTVRSKVNERQKYMNKISESTKNGINTLMDAQKSQKMNLESNSRALSSNKGKLEKKHQLLSNINNKYESYSKVKEYNNNQMRIFDRRTRKIMNDVNRIQTMNQNKRKSTQSNVDHKIID
jgi:hypothetical protein